LVFNKFYHRQLLPRFGHFKDDNSYDLKLIETLHEMVSSMDIFHFSPGANGDIFEETLILLMFECKLLC